MESYPSSLLSYILHVCFFAPSDELKKEVQQLKKELQAIKQRREERLNPPAEEFKEGMCIAFICLYVHIKVY